MAVRAAVLADKIAAVVLLRHAHEAAALPFPFSAPHAAALLLAHIGGPNAVALVNGDPGAPDAILLATAQEHPFAAVRYASETVWWIEPACRGRVASDMLAAYEEWARERGCLFAGMAALATFPRAGLIYRRRGFEAAETFYLKRL